MPGPATKARETDIENSTVFAPTPEAIPGEYCDDCGRAVPARYLAEQQGGLRLTFCAHHIRKYADKLRAGGFTITPDEIDYVWNSKKAVAEAPAS